jgi:Flp pilus assembly protein TadG
MQGKQSMTRAFLADRRGAYSIILAICAIPLLLSVGVGVDYARYLSAQAHLQRVADAASLAMAASRAEDETALRKVGNEFIAANYNQNQVDNIRVASLQGTMERVDLTLEGTLPTTFMALGHIDTLDVRANSLAIRAVSGSVEVAMVLDNTASMNNDNKIGTLKAAAKDLVTNLFSDSDGGVRVGLVPYADNINVGIANRNASWLSIPAEYVVQPEPRVCQQVSVDHQQCIRSESYTCTRTVDGVVKEQQCDRCVEYGPKTTTIEPRCTGGGDPVTHSWKGCIGSRLSGTTLVLDDQSPSIPYPGFLNTGNNKSCLSEITPLTDNQTRVQAAVSGMTTSSPGYNADTYIPAGLIWGVNMLSPAAPLTDGAAYDPKNQDPRKVIVLMTDGLNSRTVVRNGSNKGGYQNIPTVGKALDAAKSAQVNKDTETVCDYAKSKNMEIFSIAFMVDDGAAKTMLQNCATDAQHYYDATNSAAMLAAFQDIGQSLTNVRLAR